MRAKYMTRTIIVLLIAAMLGGGYLIVEKNRPAGAGGKQDVPSGFMH